MKKITPTQALTLAKNRYEEKYINPLRLKFTRPPKMFDDGQIRLRKQIERQLDELEKATLCPCCNGTGVIIEKVVETHSDTWKRVREDPREYTNDLCSNCLGDGIVFDTDWV